ncbi:TetR/AcrR family transcriptional regulator [Arthrobacter sp. AZCC_0090]|uniref:TetR/AcrR family transcriptional regulator n=1 Tax=Arthrobacter sp. AZCC_0090 TaxID=2735881 RepID=UPI001615B1E8|nr:TetR/AcrR family transcriptional regulator [Arthrobacter sp. AZCC_0090]MBB6406265.1 AcrR family transcriptional regulator [Arthrobacter sp. AZCC_0090]
MNIQTAPAVQFLPAIRAQTVLQVSTSVMELFLHSRDTAFTVKELAAHAGISERSFYRYFPRKEDAVKPFLTAGVEMLVQAVSERPVDEPFETSLAMAWDGSWSADNIERVQVLHRVLGKTDRFRSVWMDVITETEARWTQVVAQRLGIEPSSRQAALAGAAIVAVLRLSTETFGDAEPDEDPATILAANLDLLGNRLFTVRR